MLFSGPMTSSLGANLVYERNEYGELICFKANEAETNARFTSEHRYDSLGFELERLLPGGVSQSFAYDNIGRLVNSKTRQSTKVRRERRYHWGQADRLLKTEDSRYGTTSYEYNPTGHLQKATYTDGTEEYRLSDKVLGRGIFRCFSISLSFSLWLRVNYVNLRSEIT